MLKSVRPMETGQHLQDSAISITTGARTARLSLFRPLGGKRKHAIWNLPKKICLEKLFSHQASEIKKSPSNPDAQHFVRV